MKFKRSFSDEAASSTPVLGVWRAVLIGWLIVNVPAMIIMLGIFLIGTTIEFKLWWVFLALGFFLGWAWWSFTIPRWRNWALSRGVPAERLQKLTVAVGLTWPKS
jgi:hypothetical protein